MNTKPLTTARNSWLPAAGAAFLGLSLLASGMLAAQHLGHLALPGCGATSGCVSLANSRWGNVAGWPVAFLGAAWFAGLLAAWVGVWRWEQVPAWLKGAVELGAVGSVYFVGLMIVGGYLCFYCLAVHTGNLGLWAVVRARGGRSGRVGLAAALGGVAAFAAVSGLLGTAEARATEAAARRQEQLLQSSLARIVEQVRRPAASGAAEALDGRYRRGSERAAIRLVIFGDYQCSHCRTAEQAIEAALRGRDDVSLTRLHFPLCGDCNPSVRRAGTHGNACQAALAAEAAGILGGTDGFWRVNAWLVERRGEFTRADLTAALPALGFADAAKFLATMDGPEAHRRVDGDIERGIERGITGTPAVFINGVQLQGTGAENALQRAVSAAAGERGA